MADPRFLVELEPGVWLAPWRGDPGRTLVRATAQRYATTHAAAAALTAARRIRRFAAARVVVDAGEDADGGSMANPTQWALDRARELLTEHGTILTTMADYRPGGEALGEVSALARALDAAREDGRREALEKHRCEADLRWRDVDRPTMRAECARCAAPVNVADALFAADTAAFLAETALAEHLANALGNDDPPWERETWDHYDTSLELKRCRHDWAPPPELCARVAALGFSRMWACYEVNGEEDRGMERYYYGEGLAQGGETRAERTKAGDDG